MFRLPVDFSSQTAKINCEKKLNQFLIVCVRAIILGVMPVKQKLAEVEKPANLR
jgi:hypothetical protein